MSKYFKMEHKILAIVFLWLGMWLSSPAFAEQKRVLGDWEVHYIAFNTTFLTPEIARINNIQRSPNNTLINISVLDRRTKEAQEVEITGTARNLLGTTTKLQFKQVKEGKAIYYLAPFSFDDEEHYRFQIVMKQGSNSQTLRFEQKLYRE
ncbi:MAG: DUF4426 domain-containing protein [Aliiglaciecola sp.]